MTDPESIASFVTSMRRFGRHVVLFHHALAERVGLNATDSRTLASLDEHGSATAGELAEVTGLTTGAVTKIIDRLERGGFVSRQSDPADRRRVIVTLERDSDANARLGELWASFAAGADELLRTYDDEELRTIQRFADDAAALLRRETRKLGEEG